MIAKPKTKSGWGDQMTRKCIGCSKKVSFTKYWCLINNENLETEIKYVCTECMKDSLIPNSRVMWGIL